MVGTRNITINYILSLPDYENHMYYRSPLMRRLIEHAEHTVSQVECEDCKRFLEYFSVTTAETIQEVVYRIENRLPLIEYQILPQVPACITGINIIKQYFGHRIRQLELNYPAIDTIQFPKSRRT